MSARGIMFLRLTDPQISKLLRMLHTNLGHPSNSDLGRSLRLYGAKEAVITAVKGLRCDTCLRCAPRKSERPARIQKEGDFIDEIGVDCVFLKSVNGKGYWFLSIVDLSTTYQVVKHIQSHDPRIVAEALHDAWIVWAGPPSTVHLDQDGAFRAVFAEAIEGFGGYITITAGQAPWQHGRTERQGAWFKELYRRTVEHEGVVDLPDMIVTASCVASAKNTLRRRAGF